MKKKEGKLRIVFFPKNAIYETHFIFIKKAISPYKKYSSRAHTLADFESRSLETLHS